MNDSKYFLSCNFQRFSTLDLSCICVREGGICIYAQLENVLFTFSITYTLMQHGNKLPMFRVITRWNCSTTVFLNISVNCVTIK